MTGVPLITGEVVNWLLEADDPGVRYLALRDLLHRCETDDDLIRARAAAHTDGPIADVLHAMQPDGFWMQPGAGYAPKYHGTVWSIILLAQLGASMTQDERIATAVGYLLDHALADGGQFAYNGRPAGTFDCLQGNLCAALLDLGCADPRLDQAFEWMARTVTGEEMAPVTDRHARYRYTSYKVGPLFACAANDRLSCGWGAAKVMLAFGKLPANRRTPLIDRAIDAGIAFLFSIDPATAAYPTADDRPPNGSWWKFGFPVFYVTDILQVVEALTLLGCGADPRLARALDLIRDKRDDHGRWPREYVYGSKTWGSFGRKGQPSKWVTLRALRALQQAETAAVG